MNRGIPQEDFAKSHIAAPQNAEECTDYVKSDPTGATTSLVPEKTCDRMTNGFPRDADTLNLDN
jgi:hypothetical protein